jgi:peptide/nickel transport system substrate-binding protein
VKRGGRLVWPVGATDILDPYRDAGTGLFPIQAIYNGLVRMRIFKDQGVIIQPDLAAKWERPDPLTFVFHLNPGIKWQDVPPTNGRPFQAEDVRLAYERMATDQPEFTLRPFLTTVSSIQTPDDRTVVFKFSSPYGPFLNMAADSWHVILPRELFDGDRAKNEAVGTGAFILERWERGVGLFLRSNKQYFKPGRPYLDGIDFLSLTDPAALQAKFLSRELDIWSTTFQLQPQIQARVPDAVFHEVPFSPYNIEINTRKPPFNDVRVRQAVQLAVDRDLIARVGFAGHAQPGQPFGSVLKDYQLPESELPKRDLRKAKQLLEAAGYGNGFTVENSIPSHWNTDTGPEQIRASLAEVGITLKHKPMEWAAWKRNVYSAGEMDVTTTWSFVYANPDQQLWIKFHSKGGNNNSHFSDARFDKMLEDARAELDPDRAKKLYQDAARYLLEQCPNAWTVESNSLFVAQARVKNYVADVGANANFLHYKSVDEIWLDR